MTGFEPIFIDSVSFIYLVEAHPQYYKRVSDFFLEEFVVNENALLTSVLSISEFSVKPYRVEDTNLLSDFYRLLEQFQISVLDINKATASHAAQLRAKYQPLRTVDALQLATAINFGCKRFLTNDKELKKVKEIEVILINDL